MTPQKNSQLPKKPLKTLPPEEAYQLLFFSEVARRHVCIGKVSKRIGRLDDLVFKLTDPYPEAVGLFMEFGWGKPTQFVPWENVIKIDDDAILVAPPPEGMDQYPPFQDQPGWILVGEHLMGRTILDMDGRTVEVVDDVQMLQSKGRMLIVHVDISFNGFLRKWGLAKIFGLKDNLISWRYVQPLSLEDVGTTDAVSLSLTRKQVKDLPSEDLADALEELSGEEQQAIFSVLDDEKAAETLIAAEPRTQRQLVADLRNEKAKTILAQMSIPQLADLFSVLPHDDVAKLTELLPEAENKRIKAIISAYETSAVSLMSDDFLTAGKGMTAEQAIAHIRQSATDPETISYLYVITPKERTLLGVVDLRELVLAPNDALLADIMAAPVVAAQDDDTRDTIEELFVKYHFRMVPVVDSKDHLMGIIRYNDIM